MPPSVVNEPIERQRTSVSRLDEERRTAVHRAEQARHLLRRALAECDWTFEALANALGQSKSYVHAVFAGEKRMTLEFLASLPLDVRERHSCLVAEQYGWIVVRPLTGIEAQKAYVAGALGLLKPPMAKASMQADLKSEVA